MQRDLKGKPGTRHAGQVSGFEVLDDKTGDVLGVHITNPDCQEAIEHRALAADIAANPEKHQAPPPKPADA